MRKKKYGVLIYRNKDYKDYAVMLFNDKEIAWDFVSELPGFVNDFTKASVAEFKKYWTEGWFINPDIEDNIDKYKAIIKAEFIVNDNPSNEFKLLNAIFEDEDVEVVNKLIPVLSYNTAEVENFNELIKEM